MPGKLVGKVHF